MRVEGRWENGEMKDWRENYGFGPSPVGPSEDGMLDEAARRPASKPFSVSPRARPAPRSAVGHPAHGAGRRGRRPLPPILPRRGPAREVPAPPSAPGCQVVETSRSGPSVNEVPRW